MQERWAVLLREEPSSKDYREAVSSNLGYVSSALMLCSALLAPKMPGARKIDHT